MYMAASGELHDYVYVILHTGLPGPAKADTDQVDSELGDTETLTCSVTDSGNPPNWFVWTHDSGMDLTGQGRNGELTQTFTDMCMEGTYTCTPVNDLGPGTQAQVVVSLTEVSCITL